MTAPRAYAFGRRVGRARARHGSALPVLLRGDTFAVGVLCGWREITTGRRA
jgi:hypothetical protein